MPRSSSRVLSLLGFLLAAPALALEEGPAPAQVGREAVHQESRAASTRAGDTALATGQDAAATHKAHCDGSCCSMHMAVSSDSLESPGRPAEHGGWTRTRMTVGSYPFEFLEP